MQPPESFAPIGNAVTSEWTGVMAGTHIEMTVVATDIVEAVGVNDAARERGKVVVKGFNDLLSVRVSRSEEIADQFLFLGVDAENGIARIFVKTSVMGDDFELAILLRMVFERAFFQSFASSEMVLVQQLGDNLDADAKAARGQFLGQVA